MRTGRQLRELFAVILGNEDLSDPGPLWHQFEADFSEDFLYRLRMRLSERNNITFTDADKSGFAVQLALEHLSEMVQTFGKSLDFFKSMPVIDEDQLAMANEILYGSVQDMQRTGQVNVWREIGILEATSLKAEAERLRNTLNTDQLSAFSTILEGIRPESDNKLFFLDAPGGCGKTMIAKLHGTFVLYPRTEGRSPSWANGEFEVKIELDRSLRWNRDDLDQSMDKWDPSEFFAMEVQIWFNTRSNWEKEQLTAGLICTIKSAPFIFRAPSQKNFQLKEFISREKGSTERETEATFVCTVDKYQYLLHPPSHPKDPYLESATYRQIFSDAALSSVSVDIIGKVLKVHGRSFPATPFKKNGQDDVTEIFTLYDIEVTSYAQVPHTFTVSVLVALGSQLFRSRFAHGLGVGKYFCFAGVIVGRIRSTRMLALLVNSIDYLPTASQQVSTAPVASSSKDGTDLPEAKEVPAHMLSPSAKRALARKRRSTTQNPEPCTPKREKGEPETMSPVVTASHRLSLTSPVNRRLFTEDPVDPASVVSNIDAEGISTNVQQLSSIDDSQDVTADPDSTEAVPADNTRHRSNRRR
ncbi:hypothetical protein BJ508DRAFT_332749 [Ascobolus immersus RN42]|uniref:Uncharacterized protein n=1 Tax=Ascobolus immersus RN42 TaxID=1160509 RepID=A0A3N4HQG3_ASCIM|nr:hypothetical protein BJ508DRAFT_332749 [Ascobolus immersus RN42]